MSIYTYPLLMVHLKSYYLCNSNCNERSYSIPSNIVLCSLMDSLGISHIDTALQNLELNHSKHIECEFKLNWPYLTGS